MLASRACKAPRYTRRLMGIAGGLLLCGLAHAGGQAASMDEAPADPRVNDEERAAALADCGDKPCEAPKVLTVVYQSGIIIDDEVNTRARAVLKAACRAPDCVLELHDAMRSDVIDSVRSGASQVGLVGLPPAEADRVAASHHLGRLDAVLISPPGYSVVAKLAEPSQQNRWSLNQSVFSALLYLAVFLGLLVACVMAMNWRLPTTRGGATTKIDPHLRSVSNALYWIFCRWSGRFVAMIWAVVGIGFFLLLRPATAESQATLASGAAPSQGIINGAYPGRHISQLRDEEWLICDDVRECFRNLRDGRTEALAGDRDLLCHFQQQSGDHALEFQADEPFLPVLQAFVFPDTKQGKVNARLLHQAMNTSAQTSNPWRGCHGTVQKASP